MVLAPVLVVWFGFGIVPKLLIIALICFFPITVNAYDGLRSVDPELLKMMRTLGADRLQILRRAELPWALPFIFSGAKIAVAVAVIGAVFGEWAGSDSGLGHLILVSSGELSTSLTFAAIAVLSAIAIVPVRPAGAARAPRRHLEGESRTMRRMRPMMPVPVRLAAAIAAAALLLAGCGEKEENLGGAEPEQLDLALDFYVNPDHAGIYTALENGYFKRAGLRVTPRVPSDPSAPIREVAAGRADLAISYEPEVLLAREQGLDVVAVASLVDEPLTSLISLPEAGIAKPADLRGKTVATAGIPYQADYLETILAGAGLSSSDVKQVEVGFNLLPVLLGGQADAILGGFRNIEGVDLAQRGENPSVVPVNQLGVPNYDELVLVAQGERLEQDPEELRLFIGALAKGTKDAVADPAAATRNVLAASDGLDPALTRAEVDATLPLLAASPDESFGQIDAEEWALFASWMAENGLISQAPGSEDVLYDRTATRGPG